MKFAEAVFRNARLNVKSKSLLIALALTITIFAISAWHGYNLPKQKIIDVIDSLNKTIPKKPSAAEIWMANSLTLVMFPMDILFLKTTPIHVNGMILGVVYRVLEYMNSTAIFWSGTLPHGVIELPALFLGWAAWTKFIFYIPLLPLINICMKMRGRSFNVKSAFINEVKQLLSTLYICICLLALAALIEKYVTPLIMSLFSP